VNGGPSATYREGRFPHWTETMTCIERQQRQSTEFAENPWKRQDGVCNLANTEPRVNESIAGQSRYNRLIRSIRKLGEFESFEQPRPGR